MTSAVRPGMLLGGKYEILALLGAGGMGEVFKARHVHLNAFRCIKVMKAALLADDSYRARFLREARLATQIHHPNIAVVHDFEIVDDGSCYMVTEFIDGTTVRQWSAEHGPFPLPLAAEVAMQVLAGLDHIHRRGLLHRDISADNVMLSYDDDDRLVVKIIDLGVAKDVGAGPTDTTQTGMLVGNPKYMSPEQLGDLEEGQQLDGRADLYCAGIVLYEMLTGVPPFSARTPTGYIIKHLTERPPSLHAVQPSGTWPGELESVLFRALEKKRERRFPDARAFAKAMERFLTRPAGTYTRGDVDSHRGEVKAAPEAMATEITDSTTAEEAFQTAWEGGTPAAWQRFLARYGDGALAMRARQLLAEAEEFDRVSRGATESGLREFVETWPRGRHRLDAEAMLAAKIRERETEAAWAAAVDADTFAAMKDFAARFPSSSHEEEAQRAIAERLAFETAAAFDTDDAWDDYLESWSGDRHAAAARERRDAAHAREAEAYDAALAAGTTEAWQEFLDRHPSGAHSAEGESHRREVLRVAETRDWERAWEAGSSGAWDDYLAHHADSPRIAEARRCRAEAAEFELASVANTVGLWRAFIKSWPEGRHRLDAQLRLRVLQG